jgi:hypothetical protein
MGAHPLGIARAATGHRIGKHCARRVRRKEQDGPRPAPRPDGLSVLVYRPSFTRVRLAGVHRSLAFEPP